MKILTVISNFNEEHSIRKTVNDVRTNSSVATDILVIDNCSNDNSLEILKELEVGYLVHPVNTGSSAGVLKTAFTYAYYHDYDLYCHMDGDYQHKASELVNIINPILNGEADVVTGSRFLNKEGFQSLFFRRQAIYFFSRLLSVVTGRRFTDITSGFRAFNRKAIEFFATRFRSEIDTIIQLELAMFYAGIKETDVPVTMRPRKSGKSEFNLRNTVKFPVYNFVSLLGTLIQKHY